MLDRIRSSKRGPYDDEPSINGVGSLLGGDGVSLNGESVMLPEDYDLAGSIHTDGMADAIAEKKFEMSMVGSAISDPDESELMGGIGGVSPRRNLNDSRDDSLGSSGKGCVPLWLTEAPTWLKGAIAASTALLVGALVLVIIAVALNENNSGGGSSSLFIGGGGSPRTPAPIPPTTEPAPTGTPSSSPRPTFFGETYDPTGAPSTMFPSVSPSQSPTSLPTDEPSEVPPSESPTASPTKTPKNGPPTIPPVSAAPTNPPPTWAPQGPIEGSTTVFYLTAHRPRTGFQESFEQYLPQLPTDADFLMHLGDWNSPSDTNCTEQSFQDVDALYNRSSVPVYWTVGDNEYNDCPNYPDSLDLWYQYLLGYETKYWAPPRWEVQRQSPDHPENFAFVLRNVLYVAVNVVGGQVQDEREWKRRQDANLDWIDEQVDDHPDEAVLVLFMHSDPELPVNEVFFTSLFDQIRSYNKPTVMVHRNLGLDKGGLEEDYIDIPDFVVLVAEGGIWPPMRVEIDTVTGAFRWNQDDWFVPTNALI